MFLSHLNSSPRLGWGVRAASYLAAAAAGAASLALWRRAVALTAALRRAPAPSTTEWNRPNEWSTSFTNAGWAELTDANGAMLGRGRVMLSAAGLRPTDDQQLPGELRSLRLVPGLSLLPGRYWVRFEAGQHAHAIKVIETPEPNGRVPIRWDDVDLPASLVERNAN